MHARYNILLYALAALCIAVAAYALFLRSPKPPMVPDDLPTYTRTALAAYNGEKEDLPIYIALDGYVYDVTAGKEYYVPGGPYHRIAGTDATIELRLFGGDLIREKYPVVGILTPSP